MLVVSCDLVLGPLITFTIFDKRKPWPELRRDLAIVVALQLAALGYVARKSLGGDLCTAQAASGMEAA